jgi:hypothetical protein
MLNRRHHHSFLSSLLSPLSPLSSLLSPLSFLLSPFLSLVSHLSSLFSSLPSPLPSLLSALSSLHPAHGATEGAHVFPLPGSISASQPCAAAHLANMPQAPLTAHHPRPVSPTPAQDQHREWVSVSELLCLLLCEAGGGWAGRFDARSFGARRTILQLQVLARLDVQLRRTPPSNEVKFTGLTQILGQL